jgi:hypothetical protein
MKKWYGQRDLFHKTLSQRSPNKPSMATGPKGPERQGFASTSTVHTLRLESRTLTRSLGGEKLQWIELM